MAEWLVKAIFKRTSLRLLLAATMVSTVACESTVPVKPASLPVAETRAPTPVTLATPTPTFAVVPPATPPPALLVVANTGGAGAYIRPAPASSERIKAWPEGTPMVATGEERAAGGRMWKNVKDPDGNAGWVAADFLAEAPPAGRAR